MFTVVVLPAPLGPSSEKIVPAATLRSMPSSTTLSPNDLRSPAAVIPNWDELAVMLPPSVTVALVATAVPRVHAAGIIAVSSRFQGCSSRRPPGTTRRPPTRWVASGRVDRISTSYATRERVSGARDQAIGMAGRVAPGRPSRRLLPEDLELGRTDVVVLRGAVLAVRDVQWVVVLVALL